MSDISISEHIARFAVEAELEQSESSAAQSNLLGEQFDILALSLMDWCAVGRAGIDEPVSEIVRAVNIADGGQEQASIFGSTQRLPARLAAQVNGATTHALDYDDTHFLHVGHTSVVVFSTAFAIGEMRSATLAQVLQAALVGSEICCHVGHWLGRSHYEAGFHQTATAGIFGATATACRLLKLDITTTSHALGLATTMASGLTSQFGSMGKPFHAGMAAANGIEAAMLASKGFSSRQDAIQCSQGFAKSHHVEISDEKNCNFELGKRYVFADVQHKYHACCHGLHACLEALTKLRCTKKIDRNDVNKIVVRTNPRWLQVCNIASPLTGLESKFSYRHVAALLFMNHDTASLDAYSDRMCKDPGVQSFRNKVNVVGDSQLSDTQTKVRIELNTGVNLEAEYDLTDPLSLAVRQEKMFSKCNSLLGADTSSALWKLIVSDQSISATQFARTAMHRSPGLAQFAQ